jgi:hypothetical protein
MMHFSIRKCQGGARAPFWQEPQLPPLASTGATGLELSASRAEDVVAPMPDIAGAPRGGRVADIYSSAIRAAIATGRFGSPRSQSPSATRRTSTNARSKAARPPTLTLADKIREARRHGPEALPVTEFRCIHGQIQAGHRTPHLIEADSPLMASDACSLAFWPPAHRPAP